VVITTVAENGTAGFSGDRGWCDVMGQIPLRELAELSFSFEAEGDLHTHRYRHGFAVLVPRPELPLPHGFDGLVV